MITEAHLYIAGGFLFGLAFVLTVIWRCEIAHEYQKGFRAGLKTGREAGYRMAQIDAELKKNKEVQQ